MPGKGTAAVESRCCIVFCLRVVILVYFLIAAGMLLKW